MSWLDRELQSADRRETFYAASVGAGPAAARSLRKCKPCADDLVEVAEDIAADAHEADESDDDSDEHEAYECDAKPKVAAYRVSLDRELAREARRLAFYAGESAGQPCRRGQSAARSGCIPKQKGRNAPGMGGATHGPVAPKAPTKAAQRMQRPGMGGDFHGPITPRQAGGLKAAETRKLADEPGTFENARRSERNKSKAQKARRAAEDPASRVRSPEQRAATDQKKTANAVSQASMMHDAFMAGAEDHEIAGEHAKLSKALETGRVGGRKLSPRGRAVMEALHKATGAEMAKRQSAAPATPVARGGNSPLAIRPDEPPRGGAGSPATLPGEPSFEDFGGLGPDPEPEAPKAEAAPPAPSVAAPPIAAPAAQAAPNRAPASAAPQRKAKGPTPGLGQELGELASGAVGGIKRGAGKVASFLDRITGGIGVGGRTKGLGKGAGKRTSEGIRDVAGDLASGVGGSLDSAIGSEEARRGINQKRRQAVGFSRTGTRR